MTPITDFEHAFPDGSAPTRRHFLKALAAAGLVLNGLPARAAGTSGVIMGFTLTPSIEDLIVAIVGDLHTRYQPDLGTRPVMLPGNSGALAMLSVARATPDGSSALLTSSAAMTLLPLLNKLPIDPATALRPVASVGDFPFAFIVGPAVPEDVRTMADYLRWARTHPERATYGVPGKGAASHFVGTEIARLSETNLRAVAYKGLLPILQDITTGSLPAAVTARPSGSDANNFPAVRTLAVSTGERWRGSPDVPTLLELGLAETATVENLGFFVASGTPDRKVEELSDAVRLVRASPATLAASHAIGLEPSPDGIDYPAEIARVRAEWQVRIERRRFSADS